MSMHKIREERISGLTTSRIKLVEAFTSIFDEMEQTLVSQLSEEENEQMKANLTKMLL